MKTKVQLFLFFLFLTACVKPYELYYFSDKEFLESFYPYKEGQTLIFNDEKGDTIAFVVDEVTGSIFKTTSACDCISEASYTYALKSDSLCLILKVMSSSMEIDKGMHTFSISATKTHQDFQTKRIIPPILVYNYYGSWSDCLVTIEEAIPYTENENSAICYVDHVKNKGITKFTITDGGGRWELAEK